MISSKEAGLAGIYSYNGTQTGPPGNQIIVDSQVVLPDEVWLVDSCSMICIDPVSAVGIIFPGGLYICQPGTTTPANAQPGASTSIAPSLLEQQFIFLAQNNSFAGTAFPGTSSAAVTLKTFAVPPGGFVRAVWDTASPTAPGAGSTVTLSIVAVRKKICQP